VNTYGNTTVTAGTLQIANAGALPTGKGLSITGGAVLLDSGLTQAVHLGSLSITMGSPSPPSPGSPSGAAVPEPGTLALLALGGLVALGAWRRRGRTAN
jgi:hypothetical protein